MQQPANNSTAAVPRSADSIPDAEIIEAKLRRRGVPQEFVEDVLWLADHARTQRLGTFAALAKETGFSTSTVSKALRGTYEADLASFCEQVRHFRAVWTERQGFGEEPYVPELSVVKRLTAFSEMVRATAQIGVVWGPNQSGKSMALEYIAAHSAMTAYAKLPAGGGTKASMKAIAKARGGISTRKSHEELREVILSRFNKLWLLIIDEFHETLIGRGLKTVTIERIREIHDDCKCGVLLCGTDIVPDMMNDSKFKDFLGQLNNRGVLRMRIPPAPTPNDVALLCQAYKFGPPPKDVADVVKTIVTESGISKLTDYFKMARLYASKRHERAVSWEHFIIVKDTTVSWSLGQFGQDKKRLTNGSEE
jgi:DNA transposition AAA+ family ATPase